MKNASHFSVKIFFTLLLAAGFLPFTSHAQSLSPLTELNNLLSIDIVPHTPRANEKVTISIQSFRSDLNKADIAWFLNGDLKESGKGLRTFSFTVGRLGTVSKVEVVIKPIVGDIYSKVITIAPADVDLVWQTYNYVPPFYKGRALYSYDSPISIVALPSFIKNDGTTATANTLIYKWFQDTEVLDSQSGYGKSVLTLKDDLYIPRHIEVEVSSTDNVFKAHGEIDIEARPPQTLLYESNPLLGVLYNKAVSNVSLKASEMTLAAVPYFFTTTARSAPALTYKWSLNNNLVATQDDQSTVTFRREAAVSGNAAVNVSVGSILNKLQRASAGVFITFGKETSGLSF